MSKKQDAAIENVRDMLQWDNEDALLADGYEDALIGVAHRFSDPPVAGYDMAKCIQILVKRDGMTEEEAWEFFDFNTLGAYVGENGPIYMRRG